VDEADEIRARAREFHEEARAEREKLKNEYDPLNIELFNEKARMLEAWAIELELTAQTVERIAARNRKLHAELKMRRPQVPPTE